MLGVRLRGRFLRMQFSCTHDGTATLRQARPLAKTHFRCRGGSTVIQMRLPRPAATRLTHGKGRTRLIVKQGRVTTTLPVSLGRLGLGSAQLFGGVRTNVAGLPTTVGATCLGSGAGRAYGGSEVVGVDFDTTFGIAQRGDTLYWRAYLYPYSSSARRYVTPIDGGSWHHYLVTDMSGGAVVNGVLILSGGFVGSDQQSFNVNDGYFTYAGIWAWTARAGYKFQWVPATTAISPAYASGGWCSF